MTEYKQAIIVRTDLKMDKGKIAAQVGHACVEAALRSHKDDLKKWRDQGMKKIVCKVTSKKELFVLKMQAEEAGIVTALITDAGHTQVEPGSETCIALGPDKEEKIDKIIKNLRLL